MGEEVEHRWHADNNEPKLRLGKVLPCVLDIENRTLPNCRERKVSVLKLFVRIRVQVLRQLQIAVGVNPAAKKIVEEHEMLYFSHRFHLG